MKLQRNPVSLVILFTGISSGQISFVRRKFDKVGMHNMNKMCACRTYVYGGIDNVTNEAKANVKSNCNTNKLFHSLAVHLHLYL